jgi:hypothetical protein
MDIERLYSGIVDMYKSDHVFLLYECMHFRISPHTTVMINKD